MAKQKVYRKMHQVDECVHVRHVPCKSNASPIARGEDLVALQKWQETRKDGKLWVNKKGNTHFPMVRGLQFCPEDRMFLNRDKHAAIAIARLAVLQNTLGVRPKCFARWR